MATKSIIDIQVNDESFKNFQKLFNDYQAKLKSQGGQWADVNKAIQQTQKDFAKMADAAASVNASVAASTKNQDKFHSAVSATGRAMHGLSQSSRNVAGHILSATTSLIKWSSIVGVVGGLLGAGGLFGIDRLAVGAAAQRRDALGYGSSVGQNSAFRIRFGGMVDPDSFMSTVNTMQNDPAQRWIFNAMGIQNPQNMQPGALNVAVLQRLRNMWATHPENRNPMFMRALGMDKLISMQDWRRIGTSPDFNYEMSRYQHDQAALNRPASIDMPWKHLREQIDVSGQKIKNTFIDGLVPLAPELAKLSTAIQQVIAMAMKSGAAKDAIGSMAMGIKDFSAYLSSDDFKDSIEDVMDDLKILARAFEPIAHFFLKIAAAVGGNLLSEAGLTRSEARRKYEREYGLPAGLMTAIYHVSGRDPSYGLPLQNLSIGPHAGSNAEQFARILGSYLSQGSGLDLALAEARFGRRVVDPLTGKYGRDWLAHAPKDVQQYINKVELTVHNQAGGSVYTTVNGTGRQ